MSFVSPQDKSEKFNLIGCIEYLGPTITTENSEAIFAKTIGHYRAFSLRRDLQWVMYDDNRLSEVYVNSRHKVTPSVLIYARIK